MDYKNSNLVDLVQHILTSKSHTITKIRNFHKNRGNIEIVEKIDTARKHAKIIRLEQEITRLKEDLNEDKTGNSE